MKRFQLKFLIGVLIIAVFAANKIISQANQIERVVEYLLAPLNRNLTERWREERRRDRRPDRRLQCRDELIRVESSDKPKISQTENATVYTISQARVGHQSDNCDFYIHLGSCYVIVVVPKTVAKSLKLLRSEIRINATGVVYYHSCDFIFVI